MTRPIVQADHARAAIEAENMRDSTGEYGNLARAYLEQVENIERLTRERDALGKARIDDCGVLVEHIEALRKVEMVTRALIDELPSHIPGSEEGPLLRRARRALASAAITMARDGK